MKQVGNLLVMCVFVFFVCHTCAEAAGVRQSELSRVDLQMSDFQVSEAKDRTRESRFENLKEQRLERENLFRNPADSIRNNGKVEISSFDIPGSVYFRHAYGDTYVVMADLRNTGSTTYCFVKINLDFRNSYNQTIASDWTYVNGSNRTLPSIDTETDTCLTPGETGFFGEYVDLDYDNVDSIWYSVEADSDSTTVPDAKIVMASGPISKQAYDGTAEIYGTMRNSGAADAIFCKAYFALKNNSGGFLDVDFTYADGVNLGGSSSAIRVGGLAEYSTYTDADYYQHSRTDYKTGWDDYGAVNCTYSISPSSDNVPAAGGSGSISVTASATTCSWNAQSQTSWIDITRGSSGTGSGTVGYSVDANTDQSSRSGTIRVAGRTFRINQQGGDCTYSVSPTNVHMPAAGGTATVNVVTESGCPWVVTNNHSWLHFSWTNGSGPKTINVTASENDTGANRSGRANVAGKQVSVTQNYADEPTSDFTYWVPGMAHAGGSHGSQWRSNLVIHNSSGGVADVTLTYHSGGSSRSKLASIPDGAIREWVDVVLSLFNYQQDSAGAISVESERPLMVESRVFNETSDGTFGQFMPGVLTSEFLSHGSLGFVNQLKRTSTFRSNLGFVNSTNTSCDVWVTFADGLGKPIGNLITATVPAFGWTQIDDALGEAGVGSCFLGYAKLQPVQQGCRVWAYGSVVDNESGDPTTIPLVIEE